MRATTPSVPLQNTLTQFLEAISNSTFGESADAIFSRAAELGLQPNLMLKHACVLSDFGGESIQRISGAGAPIFLDDTRGYGFLFQNGDSVEWLSFEDFGKRKLGNGKLYLEAKDLLSPGNSVNGGMRDILGWLLYGRSAITHGVRGLAEGLLDIDLGALLGIPVAELERLLINRYLHVSRQTQGANANQNGQILQDLVKEALEATLGGSYSVVRNGKISIGGENNSFDVVITKNPMEDGRSVGIEVAFQVTTNSTIERKSQQAEGWREKLAPEGHALAFLIDGAGNLFERAAAVSRICDSVDCVVSFSETGLEALADFVRESLK